ncbi:MAG: metallophosphoesterase [Culicoidibacterales bacterium]
MNVKRQNITFETNANIIVISDIHANYKALKSLLKKVNYNEKKDYLIILGDIIEKGKHNIKTLAYIRKLEQKSDRLFVIEGNCDALINHLLEDENKLLAYINRVGDSLLLEWIKKLKLAKNNGQIGKAIKQHYAADLAWLDQRPTIISSNELIFVHAGIPQGELNTERETMLTVKNAGIADHPETKTVILGHFPAINYRKTGDYTHEIYIDQIRKTISIDGANQLKEDGQLNALIIKKVGKELTFTTDFVDLKPEVKIKHSYLAPLKETIQENINWPYALEKGEIIERTVFFTKCYIEARGIQWFKNEYLTFLENNQYELNIYHSTAILSVEIDDIVTIIDDTTTGYIYIKKKGILGWIPRYCIAKKAD